MTCPCSVSSSRTLLPSDSVLRTLRGQHGGPLRIPSNGGAAVTVIVQWEDVLGISIGCLVLYGVIGALRVPVAVGYLQRLDLDGAAVNEVFRVSGLPYEHFELDVAGYFNPIEGAGVPYVTVHALVGGAPAASPSVQVLDRAAAVIGNFTIPENLAEQHWIDRLASRGFVGRQIVLVTPADGADLDVPGTDGLILGAAGVVKVTDSRGTTSSPYLAAGVVHRLSVDRVWQTGTAGAVTAAGIWAVYEA